MGLYAVTIHLHMGVIDLPYSDAPTPSARRRKAKAQKRPRKAPRPRKSAGVKASNMTTGDVATILEAKYGLFNAFYEHHEEEIADEFARQMAGELENLITGAPPSLAPLQGAAGFVADKFKQAITDKEFDDYGIPGVPTKAAIERGSGKQRSSRFKNKKPASDASFYDSGLFEDSATAWVERT